MAIPVPPADDVAFNLDTGATIDDPHPDMHRDLLEWAGGVKTELDPLILKLDSIETGATTDQVASEVPFTPTGGISSVNVQAALAELDSEKANVVHAHPDLNIEVVASDVPFTPSGNIASTDVQTAIQELDADKANATHGHTLGDLTDTNLTGLADGYVLSWNAATARWIVQAMPGGGGDHLDSDHANAYEPLGSVATHAAESNPHPIYLTQPEGDARYSQTDTNTQRTDEEIQDVTAGQFTHANHTNITVVYDDATGQIQLTGTAGGTGGDHLDTDHDDRFAQLDHTHDFAVPDHTHEHNHDLNYSDILHDHHSDYSLNTHNHFDTGGIAKVAVQASSGAPMPARPVGAANGEVLWLLHDRPDASLGAFSNDPIFNISGAVWA